MKKFLTGCILLLPAFLKAQEKLPKGIEHVIIIGVDGMSPDGIKNANTPVMHKLIAQGAVKWNVRTVLPSSSSPNWASMIMGAGPEQHGITDNDWQRDKHTLPPVVANEEGIFPTIFGVLHQQYPKADIGAVYHWDDFGRLFEKNAVNHDRHFSTEDSTATDFIQYIRTAQPLFAFVHFDHVDHAGHEYGHGSPLYYQAVAKTDSLIGRIMENIPTNTLVIITADHGGKGKSHGGATPEEAEIAMIFSGKDVKAGYEIKQPVYTYDLAATIAFALHAKQPYAWIGRPVKSAFAGFNEPLN
jgi:predicted AlkP superfamily pyrophosphatase or phosphodiesterase